MLYNKHDHQKIHGVIKTAKRYFSFFLFGYPRERTALKVLNEKYTPRCPFELMRCRRNASRTCAVRVGAFSALCPMSSALRSPMSSRWALPLPLLRSIGTGHRAIAPCTPLLPLPVHWARPCRTQKQHPKWRRENIAKRSKFPELGLEHLGLAYSV